MNYGVREGTSDASWEVTTLVKAKHNGGLDDDGGWEIHRSCGVIWQHIN